MKRCYLLLQADICSTLSDVEDEERETWGWSAARCSSTHKIRRMAPDLYLPRDPINYNSLQLCRLAIISGGYHKTHPGNC